MVIFGFGICIWKSLYINDDDGMQMQSVPTNTEHFEEQDALKLEMQVNCYGMAVTAIQAYNELIPIQIYCEVRTMITENEETFQRLEENSRLQEIFEIAYKDYLNYELFDMIREYTKKLKNEGNNMH